jgi:uncharacterized protein (TIGR02145 family)
MCHLRICQMIKCTVIQFSLTVFLSCSDDEPPSVPATVNDIDGNLYHTVVIGSQAWTVENLKVTKYSNGEPIINLTDPGEWNNTVTTGTWCYIYNDPSVNRDYGKHYNWYAVNDSRKLCPIGWHVPTDDEWMTLANHLGGVASAGGKMKEEGFGHWRAPNTGATNESGFSGLPGGTVGYGGYADMGAYGRWWTSTEYDIASFTAYFVWISDDNTELNIGEATKELGFCVRCLKN